MSQYIVGSITKTHDTWSVSPRPAIHSNRESAVNEAKRLANTSNEKRFVVLKVEGVAKRVEVAFEEV